MISVCLSHLRKYQLEIKVTMYMFTICQSLKRSMGPTLDTSSSSFYHLRLTLVLRVDSNHLQTPLSFFFFSWPLHKVSRRVKTLRFHKL